MSQAMLEIRFASCGKTWDHAIFTYLETLVARVELDRHNEEKTYVSCHEGLITKKSEDIEYLDELMHVIQKFRRAPNPKRLATLHNRTSPIDPVLLAAPNLRRRVTEGLPDFLSRIKKISIEYNVE